MKLLFDLYNTLLLMTVIYTNMYYTAIIYPFIFMNEDNIQVIIFACYRLNNNTSLLFMFGRKYRVQLELDFE